MAEEEQSRLDFTEILSNVNRKFEIILLKWSNNKDFEIRIRTEIEKDNDDFNFLCDQWVDIFSTVTNTIWVKKISNTGPKIRFRKQYQCWTHGTGKVQKELLFDSRRCKAVLDMKVLTDTPLTRRKNKHIRMGLNAVVKINFSHLHPVDPMQPFSFFVHNCQPLQDQLTSQQILLPQQTSLDSQILKQDENVTTVTIADLTEPFIMFDPITVTHTLNLGQPSVQNTHLVHSHPGLLQNQHSHDHYL